jgi:hypothetical protein
MVLREIDTSGETRSYPLPLDDRRRRIMTDYGTAASANFTPSRDMVEQSSRLATELELARAMDLKIRWRRLLHRGVNSFNLRYWTGPGTGKRCVQTKCSILAGF